MAADSTKIALPVQRSDFDRWQLTVDRPVDRKEQRALLSDPVDRPVDRTTVLPDVHSSVHVGRPLGRSAIGSVDRPGLSASSGSETGSEKHVKILLSLLKIP